MERVKVSELMHALEPGYTLAKGETTTHVVSAKYLSTGREMNLKMNLFPISALLIGVIRNVNQYRKLECGSINK